MTCLVPGLIREEEAPDDSVSIPLAWDVHPHLLEASSSKGRRSRKAQLCQGIKYITDAYNSYTT